MKIFLKKLFYTLFTLYLILSSVFFGVRMAPGDPVMKILGPEAKQEEITRYRTQLGLDKPVYIQYGNFFKDLVKGDFGTSLFKKESVWKLLKKHMAPTFILAFLSIALSAFLGIFLGFLGAIYKSQKLDYVLRVFSLCTLAFPIFSLGPVLVLIFAIKFELLPVSEWGGLTHMILPTLTLVLPLSSVISRVTRNKFLEERSSLWVTVLKAKGLSKSSIYKNILKICLPTILNVLALQLSVVLAGTMITESIFDIPGMGLLLFESIQNRDYPIVQGVITYSTVVYMLTYFVLDYINEKIDPRLEG